MTWGGAGPERLTGWISCFAGILPAATPQSPPARFTGGRQIHDPFGWQMIGQRTACQLLAGEGANFRASHFSAAAAICSAVLAARQAGSEGSLRYRARPAWIPQVFIFFS